MTPIPVALLLLSALTALLAALALWASLRHRPFDPAPFEALRRHAEELASRDRGEAQQALATQIRPLQAELGALRTAQAEKLGEGFRLLATATQDALRASREEQAAQLAQVQLQVERRLEAIQASNEERLERMRRTVDEKLHEALEKRLGESFNLVAQRLEQVQKGLGEMQSLAQDVGGLKRALTNVKTRGVLGEAQLGALLEQFLSAGQYAANVKIRPRSAEVVEFAVKLPGAEEGGTVWLPIDAKFPLEDYQRLMEAYEVGDLAAVETAGRALENRLLGQALDIRDKYIAPPHSTDFALLFLPFEGLYAEALRRPGLLERIQRECKVTFVGPTTLTAFLNSLQVGFKTLAITKQSGEVWKLLGHVKAEFGKFGESLALVQKKLDEASSRLGDVSKRKELMEKRLAGVEALPESEGTPLLAAPSRSE
ncbi:DNA recombination protein RmuC [Geothrix sp. PMB-07]|uniref:DNA recombination protein RmuC n=1 Tax=Geothrix sp. PMB-07 TaxID=3068640 RepID=UPI0027405197|nr:DNA recombination protein RmuC [Geothrix sp. PMB-07]WLT33325.1 DNA recombination protein RmuC [Geothrix sp. PMB-07]